MKCIVDNAGRTSAVSNCVFISTERSECRFTNWNLGSVNLITEKKGHKSRECWCSAPGPRHEPLIWMCPLLFKKKNACSRDLSIYLYIYCIYIYTNCISIYKFAWKLHSIEIAFSTPTPLGGCFHPFASKCGIWTHASSITSQWTSCR